MVEFLKKIDFKKIVDILVCLLFVLLSIKKGGFYASDSFIINILIIAIAATYIIFYIITKPVEKSSMIERITISQYLKRNVLNILIILLPIAYLLSIVFGRAIDTKETIYEFIRYVNFTMIYFLIKFSSNKKYYINTIVIIAIVQCIVGIDGLGLRIFQDILKPLHSGYVSVNLDRLSGTIQYANTLALIVAVSGLIVLDKYIKSKKKNYVKPFLYTLLSMFSSTIILTGTRTVPLLLIPILIAYAITNRKYIKELVLTFLTQIILVLIYTSTISKYLIIQSINIYYVFIAFIAISYIIEYIIQLLKDRLLKESSNKVILKPTILIIVLVSVIMYFVLALNISKPLEVSEDSKIERVKREVYGFNNDTVNDIDIVLGNVDSNSKYIIYLYAEHERYNKEYITQFNNYQNLGNIIHFEYTPKHDFLRLNIEIQCMKGNISIEEFKLNGKEIKLEYTLLPSEYVFRIKNMLKGTDSINSRLTYMKDALKIIKTSPIVGVGGDGFNKMYKEVQTTKYSSSEVHNSFLQIFVETGILGGTIVVLIVILSLIKSKKEPVILVYILFICHSLIDLNLSYMLMIVVFATLIVYSTEDSI